MFKYCPQSMSPAPSTLLSRTSSGFSVVELLTVLLVIGVLAAISVPYFFSYTKLYRSDDQSLLVIDAMQEASQRALSRRSTVRFEVDLTANSLNLIDEDPTGPDQLFKSMPLLAPELVRIDAPPPAVAPPNPPNYATAVFANDNIGHERDGVSVTGNRVWAARFRSDGSVVGANGVPLNSSLFIWSPRPDDVNAPNSIGEIRALTMFAGSGAVRYWRYDGTEFKPY
ncbi:MAG TPA: prepilin-type N-terminal cleavage/methylation domain-containing protein [Pyrinomonadaceae bacterium]|nr:prepilin-type N-terminal cleavage/methylation domain-containing protein [Pyrinomonadaceae bacterium]